MYKQITRKVIDVFQWSLKMARKWLTFKSDSHHMPGALMLLVGWKERHPVCKKMRW